MAGVTKPNPAVDSVSELDVRIEGGDEAGRQVVKTTEA